MSEFGKGEELLKLETVTTAIEEASVWAGNEFASGLRGFLPRLISLQRGLHGAEMESPIEAVFLAWFMALNAIEETEVCSFGLVPQCVVDIDGQKSRFDFSVRVYPSETLTRSEKVGIDPPKLAIELDGHDFHERTKEQVATRNARDRRAQGAGWTILHFSGSEIHRDPLKCVRHAMDICKSKHDEWLNIVWNSPSE
jgi:hypothetical protein